MTFAKHGYVARFRECSFHPTEQSTTPVPRSKVVIGDLDVSGAEAVVASITKNGG